MRRALALLAFALPGAAAADPLVVAKTVTMVADPLANANPRSLPGATADYRTRVTNPLGNLTKTVAGVKLEEPIAANVVLYVRDLAAAGKGPVEVADGGLLGLLGSALTYSYTALTAPADGLEFWDGTSWTYQPVADADGYDAKVRAVRVTLSGSFATGGAFQLRYRVKIR